MIRIRSTPVRSGAPMLLALLVAGCGDDSSGPEAAGPPVIDGSYDPEEWAGATVVPITDPLWNGSPGSTLYVTTDGTDLFLGVRVPTGGEILGDEEVHIRFDNDNDDVDTVGDDALTLGPDGFEDQHFAPGHYRTPDQNNDGNGAYAAAGGDLFFELRHPLNSGDPDDMAIAPGSVIGLCVRYFRDGGFSGEFPDDCIFAVNGQTLYHDVVVDLP